MAGIEGDDDIQRALGWIRNCIGEAPQAYLRRMTLAMRHYMDNCGLKEGRWARSEALLLPSDLPGAWLAQAVAFLSNARAYDARLGSRILPLIKAIGIALPGLSQVDGVLGRVQRMMAATTVSPESALFELAMAGRYLREGLDIAFIPEGRERTADLSVVVGDHRVHVECKRLQASTYETEEGRYARALFVRLEDLVEARKVSLFLDVKFTVEVRLVPPDYLAMHADRAVQSRLALPDGYPWRDEYGQGVVRHCDLGAVAADTVDTHVLVGPKVLRLLTGRVLDPAKCMISLRADSAHEDDTRYVADVSQATVVHWECLALSSVEARARFIKSKLADVDRQVATAPLAIVHFGMDAARDSVASDLKRDLNKRAATEFMAESQLVELELHYFMPRELERVSWASDEMVDTFIRGNGTSLLRDPRLMPGDDLGDLPPWHIPND